MVASLSVGFISLALPVSPAKISIAGCDVIAVCRDLYTPSRGY